MFYNNLHIGDDFFSSKYLLIKILLLGVASGIIHKMISRQQLWIKTGTVDRLVRDFEKVITYNEQILSLTDDRPKELIIEAHTQSEKQLERYQKMYNNLEKNTFFGNEKLALTAEKLLLTCYAVEAKMRSVALSDIRHEKEDESLFEFASDLSLSSSYTSDALHTEGYC